MRQKNGIGSPGTGVLDAYEMPWKCCKQYLGPLQEQQVPLPTEPPLQPDTKVLKTLPVGFGSVSNSLTTHYMYSLCVYTQACTCGGQSHFSLCAPPKGTEFR